MKQLTNTPSSLRKQVLFVFEDKDLREQKNLDLASIFQYWQKRKVTDFKRKRVVIWIK